MQLPGPARSWPVPGSEPGLLLLPGSLPVPELPV
jgi:hypothetical protein